MLLLKRDPTVIVSLLSDFLSFEKATKVYDHMWSDPCFPQNLRDPVLFMLVYS